MKLKIHHPRILIVLLLVIVAAASAAILLANEEESEEDEFPTKSIAIPAVPIPTPTPFPEQYKEEAVNIVKESGVVENINGGQDWEVTGIFRAKLAGTEGVSIHVAWSEPVESTGPWSIIQCEGTLRSVSTTPWSQVDLLRVKVDMKAKSVVGVGVWASVLPDVHQPVMGIVGPGDGVTLYDVESGDIVYDGPYSDIPTVDEVCEEGTYGD